MPALTPTTTGAKTSAAAAAKAAFVAQLSRLTGLSSKTVDTWVAAEGADAPGGTGGFNYLNVRARPGDTGRPAGTGYSGVAYAGVSSGGFAQFASAADAARETAYWIDAMPHYAGIRAAAGKGVGAELAAIARSPWDSNHYRDANGRAGGKLLAAAKGGGGGIGGAISGAAGAVGGVISDLNPANAVKGVAGAIENAGQTFIEGLLRIVIAGLILGLAAVLFYTGIRRLSGDRLPGAGQLANAATANRGPISPETAALFA